MVSVTTATMTTESAPRAPIVTRRERQGMAYVDPTASRVHCWLGSARNYATTVAAGILKPPSEDGQGREHRIKEGRRVQNEVSAVLQTECLCEHARRAPR
jgi:hypothetical protein